MRRSIRPSRRALQAAARDRGRRAGADDRRERRLAAERAAAVAVAPRRRQPPARSQRRRAGRAAAGSAAPPAAPAGARGESGPDQRNRQDVRQIAVDPAVLKSPGETIDDFNARAKDAAKDAADTLSRLATPLDGDRAHGLSGSANGAPDCKAASDKLCQSKGFKEGKSLTTDSAEACSAKVLDPRPHAQAGRLPDR